jgi:hypothetical protein
MDARAVRPLTKDQAMPSTRNLPDETRGNISDRLKRIEGQSRGIQKLLEDGRDCIDDPDQSSSVKPAVNDLSGGRGGSARDLALESTCDLLRGLDAHRVIVVLLCWVTQLLRQRYLLR